jgi:hypothetical protein
MTVSNMKIQSFNNKLLVDNPEWALVTLIGSGFSVADKGTPKARYGL